MHPLHHDRYVRSNDYDPDWVFANQMGPNALWLLESLTEVLPIEPGTKILDLGCGRAMSSIFLAREFEARVWATDLWIPAADNQRRIVEAGVDDLVTPIHAEAHDLPFADGFFDLVISIDAYQYFGTDDLYLGYLVNLLGDGGRLGMVMPSLFEDITSDVPDELAPYWEWEFCCLHDPDWWQNHWTKSTKVTVDHAEAIEDGWRDWRRFEELSEPHLEGWRKGDAAKTVAMLDIDQGRRFGFTRITATKR